MPKTKLKSFDCQDINYFGSTYQNIELKICKELEEFFTFDDYIPIITRLFFSLMKENNTISDKSVNALKVYLDSNHNTKVIILDIFEGTNIIDFIDTVGLTKYCELNQIYFITSGELPQNWKFVNIHVFADHTFTTHNQYMTYTHHDDIFLKTVKPYTFLFLNKVARDHRQALINQLSDKNLLDKALWSDLSQGIKISGEYKDMFNNNNYSGLKINNIVFPLNWPDGKICPELFIDTYFSVVTETNYNNPYQYYTEKIYKTILIGHPFIAVSSKGFYKGLKNQGYKTFENLIDETFDQIDDNDLRLRKIVNSIEYLCKQDLIKFLKEAEHICKHNRLTFFENLGKNQFNNHYNLKNFLEQLN